MPNSDWGTTTTPSSATRTLTDVVGGAALPTNVSHFGALANAAGFLKNDGSGGLSYDNTPQNTALWGSITGTSAQAAPAGGWTGNHGAMSMGTLSATSGSFTLPVVCHSMSAGANFTGNWSGANYWGIGPISSHGIRLGMVNSSNAFMTPPGDMSLQVDASVSMTALTATTGTFSAPVRPGSYTVATLPAGTVGQMAYATDARKAGEGSGAGTGLLLVYTNGNWRDPSQAYAVATA
jgi:hypothetical protein